MKSHTKNIVLKFSIVAIVMMVLYNFFGHYLTAIEVIPINAWFITPFILVLLSIAVIPFVNRIWWDKYYQFIACILGLLCILAS
jgi:hypothetical protein